MSPGCGATGPLDGERIIARVGDGSSPLAAALASVVPAQVRSSPHWAYHFFKPSAIRRQPSAGRHRRGHPSNRPGDWSSQPSAEMPVTSKQELSDWLDVLHCSRIGMKVRWTNIELRRGPGRSLDVKNLRCQEALLRHWMGGLMVHRSSDLFRVRNLDGNKICSNSPQKSFSARGHLQWLHVDWNQA